MGPAHYDLASLLRDSYVELDEEFVADRPRSSGSAPCPASRATRSSGASS